MSNGPWAGRRLACSRYVLPGRRRGTGRRSPWNSRLPTPRYVSLPPVAPREIPLASQSKPARLFTRRNKKLMEKAQGRRKRLGRNPPPLKRMYPSRRPSLRPSRIPSGNHWNSPVLNVPIPRGRVRTFWMKEGTRWRPATDRRSLRILWVRRTTSHPKVIPNPPILALGIATALLLPKARKAIANLPRKRKGRKRNTIEFMANKLERLESRRMRVFFFNVGPLPEILFAFCEMRKN